MGDLGHLEHLLALLPDAYLVVNSDGRIVFSNDQANLLLGYAAGELAGACVETLIPQRLRKSDAYYRARFKTRQERRRASDSPSIYAVHKDGHEIPVAVGYSSVEGDQFVICSIKDMTSHIALEGRLREAAAELERRARSSEGETRRANEHFMLFLKHAPAAIAMLDRAMRYLIVSDRWLGDLGLAGRDVHGIYHYDLFPDSSEKWKEIHKQIMAGEVRSGEDAVIDAGGREQWLFWEAHPWKWADGRIGGVLWFSEVITRRKQAEAELLKSHQQLEKRVAMRTSELQSMKDAADRANAQKTWFVAAASHDLRQPLQASIAYLSAMLPKLDNPELREMCDKARQPLNAMGDILDVLLDISDMERGRVRPRLETFELCGLLQRVLASCQNQAQEKGLHLSCAATDLWVRSDPKLLERVLCNFVTNAIRYTERGLIGLYCERADGKVCISVTDTGIGIPQDALGAIFEDHVQLANPARDRRKGLGLGLSIAKRIADSLGHRIGVSSELGSGSSFTIELPEAEPLQSEQQPASRDAPAPGRRPIVLLIDDDPDVAEAMQLLLQSYGFETYRAPGRDAALAMLESGLTPGLVLCDYRLPGVNGIDLIRQVRSVLHDTVPAVLLTGDTGLQRCPENLERCALMHKPMDVDAFLALVESLTDQGKTHRD